MAPLQSNLPVDGDQADSSLRAELMQAGTPVLEITRRIFLLRSLGILTLSPLLYCALRGLALAESAGTSAPPDSARDPALAARISDDAIERRKKLMIRTIAADPAFTLNQKNPKQQHAIVGARLCLNAKDADALEYVRRVAGFSDSFAYSGLATLFARFGDGWSEELVEAIRQSATSCPEFVGGGTENMVAMWRTAGLIFGERFPEEKFKHGLSGRELAQECKNYMRKYGRAVFGGSMTEYLSPIYLATNTAAWIDTADCARDDEARLMSQAILDWMFVDLALNSFEGATIAPLTREKGLLTGTYQRSFAVTNTQWASWIFFGSGNTRDDGVSFEKGREPLRDGPPGLHALSKWMPHPVIRNIAAKRVSIPYSIKQARAGWAYIEPAMVNAYGKTAATGPVVAGLDGPRYHFRSAYMNRTYAIGAGSFKTDPAEPGTSTVLPFGVWWKSEHDNNFLLVAHPFWHVGLTLEKGGEPLGDDDRLGISPFCRAVHCENAALLLYDFPEDDPYLQIAHRGSKKFRSERPAKVIHSVFVHVPETVDERIQKEKGFFIREGDVYIGIRPLVEGARWTTSKHKGFVRIEIPGAISGLAIEVGDSQEFGSFQHFQAQILAAKLDVDRLSSAKTTEYISTRGHKLQVAPQPETWLPDASVDGVKLDFETWPITESPFVNCKDRVLDVNDGLNGFTIDWSGDLPIYTYYSLHDGKRTETGRRFLRAGKLVEQSGQ